MLKHLFYSLLITFFLAALAEFIRPSFATNFLNTNVLFLLLIICGCLIFLRQRKDKEEKNEK